MSNLTVSTPVDTFMQSADQTAMRNALNLGSASTQPVSAFDPNGSAATAQSNAVALSLQKAANLGDVANVVTTRANLGLGSAALQPTSSFDVSGAAANAQSTAIAASCQRASNLSDVASATTSRTNLGLDLLENDQTVTAYTLVLSDNLKWVSMTNASANVLTVPQNSDVAFPVGAQIPISQDGAGQTTVAAGAGVTIQSAGGLLALRAQFSSGFLYKRSTDTWRLVGDLA